MPFLKASKGQEGRSDTVRRQSLSTLGTKKSRPASPLHLLSGGGRKWKLTTSLQSNKALDDKAPSSGGFRCPLGLDGFCPFSRLKASIKSPASPSSSVTLKPMSTHTGGGGGGASTLAGQHAHEPCACPEEHHRQGLSAPESDWNQLLFDHGRRRSCSDSSPFTTTTSSPVSQTCPGPHAQTWSKTEWDLFREIQESFLSVHAAAMGEVQDQYETGDESEEQTSHVDPYVSGPSKPSNLSRSSVLFEGTPITRPSSRLGTQPSEVGSGGNIKNEAIHTDSRSSGPSSLAPAPRPARTRARALSTHSVPLYHLASESETEEHTNSISNSGARLAGADTDPVGRRRLSAVVVARGRRRTAAGWDEMVRERVSFESVDVPMSALALYDRPASGRVDRRSDPNEHGTDNYPAGTAPLPPTCSFPVRAAPSSPAQTTQRAIVSGTTAPPSSPSATRPPPPAGRPTPHLVRYQSDLSTTSAALQDQDADSDLEQRRLSTCSSDTFGQNSSSPLPLQVSFSPRVGSGSLRAAAATIPYGPPDDEREELVDRSSLGTTTCGVGGWAATASG